MYSTRVTNPDFGLGHPESFTQPSRPLRRVPGDHSLHGTMIRQRSAESSAQTRVDTERLAINSLQCPRSTPSEEVSEPLYESNLINTYHSLSFSRVHDARSNDHRTDTGREDEKQPDGSRDFPPSRNVSRANEPASRFGSFRQAVRRFIGTPTRDISYPRDPIHVWAGVHRQDLPMERYENFIGRESPAESISNSSNGPAISSSPSPLGSEARLLTKVTTSSSCAAWEFAQNDIELGTPEAIQRKTQQNLERALAIHYNLLSDIEQKRQREQATSSDSQRGQNFRES